ncbi:stalk domain-containing protein [Paenibacillus lemnae]|uniref:Copper amine oxidase N-terminal domain-containing protein n=1 Tax=Paenibacillus lemnae TaxID=1330551 RepID=A0A848MC97_PAELE|nr:stalk domain-containing protein [Paenibacillus lemnae]NMO97849.1 copper amine oxidase N-terminal domain-containing protein [Paenibacillus lemnae]
MKLKKLSILALLVVVQAAAVMPAGAEPVSAETTQGTVTQEVYDANTLQEETDGSEPVVDGSVEGEVIEEPDQPGTEVPNPPVVIDPEPAVPVNINELIFYFNSTKLEQGGQVFEAPQPMQVKKGVSYVPIRTLVDRVGFKVKYEAKTKETVITKGDTELRFKTDSANYLVNGVSKPMKGASYQTQNTFMVPLTSITQALDIKYKVDNVGKRVIMNLELKPTAKFTVEPKEIYAGETLVTYKTEVNSPLGLPIINERWEGREEIFATPGAYVVSYAVQDESGTWSDPYQQTIQVIQPNQPPVAAFTTDKSEYKMGEWITYSDQSYDDVEIKSHQWENNAYAFFTPGPKTIQLTVTDNKGLTSTVSHTINITDEILYAEDDFNKLFIPAGEKFSFNGSEVTSRPKVSYTYQDETSTLIRSNSPETVNTLGNVYRETAYGDMRFMIHHVNNVNKNVKMYVIATNNNAFPAVVRTDHLGFAGPTYIATAAGKKSVLNYFESMQDGSKQSSITLAPGESQLVMTELSKTRMKQGDVISLFSDMYSDLPIQFDVIMIDEKADPLKVWKDLPLLDKDGVHNRGTYPNSTRMIQYSDLVGNVSQRLLLGDNGDDPNLIGTDPMYGSETDNAGNFGVLYKIRLDRVAPNTLISFNPRGGKYSGYAMVNGAITAIYSKGQVSAPDEQAVLYRTGEYEQRVEIILTAAPGSNLPVNLLFTQMPAK